jgi:hypothetical protein
MKIPVYSDGRRLFNRTLADIERLETKGRALIERRKGRIVCAHLRPTEGASPVRTTAHMGQSYSYAQPLPSGHRAWKHSNVLISNRTVSEIVGKEVDSEQADLFIRAIFRAVPLSCMGMAKPTPPTANVVAIDSYRKKTRKARPIEFDSERQRAA